MELSSSDFLLLLLAGLATGFVNTLAGNGSVFTLSTMLLMGIPAHIANGTNRVGTLFQSATAITTLFKTGKLKPKQHFKRLLPSLFGALVGALTATEIEKEMLELVMGTVMMVLLLVIIFKPQKYLTASMEDQKLNIWGILILFFVGFYGGFIQAGIGILLIVTGTSLLGLSMLEANNLKLLVVGVFIIPVLCIFIWKDQVLWIPGLLLAVGQAVGAFLAGKYAINIPSIATYIRYLLIVMILLSLTKIFLF